MKYSWVITVLACLMGECLFSAQPPQAMKSVDLSQDHLVVTGQSLIARDGSGL